MRDADLGVRGGEVGMASRSGGARLPSRRGVDGAEEVKSEVGGGWSLIFCATGTRGWVQWRP